MIFKRLRVNFSVVDTSSNAVLVRVKDQPWDKLEESLSMLRRKMR